MYKRILQTDAQDRSVSREPLTAALLSVIPGAGQLYNGQGVKGLLFMDVAAINFVLLWVIVFAQPMTESLKNFLLANKVNPNSALLSAIASTHLGTPLSLIVLTMVALFGAYTIRDAYDTAAKTRRDPIYANAVINISEATSGSYLLHCASIFCCAILALFFLVPKPERSQVTEFVFESNPIERQKPREKKILSENNSRAKGDHETKKPTPSKSNNATPRRPAQPTHSTQPPTPARPTRPARSAEPPKAQPAPPQHAPTLPAAHATPAPAAPAPTAPQPTPSLRAAAPAAVPIPLPQKSASAATTAPPSLLPTLVPNTAGLLAFAPPPSVHRGTTGGAATPRLQPVGISGVNIAPHPMPGIGTNSSHSQSVVPGLIAPVKGNGANNIGAPNPAPAAAMSNRVGLPMGAGTVPEPSRGVTGAGNPNHSLAATPVGATPARENVPTTPDHGGLGKTGDDIDRTKSVDFGPYMAALERRIKRNWTPPRMNNSKRAVARFVISRNGTLSHLALANSSGVAIVDQAALKAIEMAAPFPPLPPGADETVDIQFTFDYNVFGGHATTY